MDPDRLFYLVPDPSGPFALEQIDDDEPPVGILLAEPMTPRQHLRERAEYRLAEARQALAELPADTPEARRQIAITAVRRAAAVLEGEIRLEEQRLEFATGPHD